MKFPPNHPQMSYVKKTTEATGLSQKVNLLDMSKPEVFYGKFLSCCSELPSVRTPPELQTSSTADGIPAPDKTSPPATRKVHPRAFIVDDFDKCVIRRKSKNFTWSGSSYPPLTGCLQFHYVNVSVLIFFFYKKPSVFILIIISP